MKAERAEGGCYVGGVLGYINNGSGSVRNCYNYGAVQNGGGDYCGAIVGWLRSHSAGNFTDNYYLDTSAPGAIGSGSNNTSMTAPAKTKAEFASGEVCYLVNSRTSTGDKAIWKQDIDNGNTPYDIYPLFDAAAVYFRSDSTYSNEPERISITISWGSMEFDYNAGQWDPDTHVLQRRLVAEGYGRQRSVRGKQQQCGFGSRVHIHTGFGFIIKVQPDGRL